MSTFEIPVGSRQESVRETMAEGLINYLYANDDDIAEALDTSTVLVREAIDLLAGESRAN